MTDYTSMIPVVKVIPWRADKVLLLNKGFWDLAGGQMAPGGEAVISAAEREVAEETGIKDLSHLWHMTTEDTVTPMPGIGFLRIHFCAARVPDHAKVILSAEHREFRWVDPVEAALMLNTSLFADGNRILAKLGLSNHSLGLVHQSTETLNLTVGEGTEAYLLAARDRLVRHAKSVWRLTNSNLVVNVPAAAEEHLFTTGNWVPWLYSAG